VRRAWRRRRRVYRQPGRFRHVRLGTDGDRFAGRPGVLARPDVLARPVRRRFASGHGGLAGAYGQFAGYGESGHGGRLAGDRGEFASGGG
jgi:hypothetical protein